MKTFRIGGVHPAENKLSASAPIKVADLPKTAVFPMGQHIGAPATPIVKKGDKVKVGTKIAEAGGFVSAPIFSSVSGTVLKIDTVIDASGYPKPAVYITVEGDEWEENIDRSPELVHIDKVYDLDSKEIIEKIKNAGIVGMGGACFPTHVKLTPPPGSHPTCVIINAVECKSFYQFDIHIEVVPLKVKYPQGGEKQLIDAVIKRQVPAPPALPVSVGAIIQNVGTAMAVYEAVMKNKPLFERVVTVTGKSLAHPSNFLVRMGTPMSQLIDACGGLPSDTGKVIGGGPMMGKALMNTDVPICKGSSGVLIMNDKESKRGKVQPCIRCAKCVNACPMGLEPFLLSKLSEAQNWERSEAEDVTSCIECGSCQFTCPSHRPLLDLIRVGKSTVMGIIRSRHAK